MGERKMGGHRGTEERRQVSTLREKNNERIQEELPKMCTTCKSHTDERFAKGLCCSQKKSSGKHGSQT